MQKKKKKSGMAQQGTAVANPSTNIGPESGDDDDIIFLETEEPVNFYPFAKRFKNDKSTLQDSNTAVYMSNAVVKKQLNVDNVN